MVNQLRHDMDMATIWVTHDLGVVAGITDRLAVMYAGRVVESGRHDELLQLNGRYSELVLRMTQQQAPALEEMEK